MLEDPVGDLVRKDSLFAKLGLDESDYRTPEPVVELLLQRPRLMQRPVVVKDGRAIIGRPKSRVAAFLADA
jgi:arsenate reductase